MTPPAGQGLIAARERDSVFGAADAYRGVYEAQSEAVARASEWQQTYRAAPQRAVTLLGSAGSDRAAEDAMVNIVTSPKTYSSIDPQYTGGKFFVPSPLDQRPCATCVAHAVIMAAETAVAIRTNKDVRREISRLSVQDFYWASGWGALSSCTGVGGMGRWGSATVRSLVGTR